MSIQNYSSNNQKTIMPSVSPRMVSFLLLGIALLLALLLFQPISMVFKGEYILQPELKLFDLNQFLSENQNNQSNPFIQILTFFNISQISIRYYAICMLIGVLSGFFLTLFLASRHFIAETLIDRLFVGIIVVGLAGARVLFILFNTAQFTDPLDYINLQKGGLAIFGAILAATIYTAYYCNKYKFNFWEFGDFLAPGLLLGQIIGRFGNFFNYEAYGFPTRTLWKMYVPENIVHSNPNTKFFNISIDERFFNPTFLYEIIPNSVLLFLILFYYQKLTDKRAGLVLGLYMIGYGLIRFLTEFQRLDALRIVLPSNIQFKLVFFDLLSWDVKAIYISQLIAFALFIAGVYLFLNRRRILYNKRLLTEVR